MLCKILKSSCNWDAELRILPVVKCMKSSCISRICLMFCKKKSDTIWIKMMDVTNRMYCSPCAFINNINNKEKRTKTRSEHTDNYTWNTYVNTINDFGSFYKLPIQLFNEYQKWNFNLKICKLNACALLKNVNFSNINVLVLIILVLLQFFLI